MGLTSEKPWFDSQDGNDVFLFIKTTKPPMRQNQYRTLIEARVVPLRVKRLEREACHSPL
jgi:hypothetical protein